MAIVVLEKAKTLWSNSGSVVSLLYIEAVRGSDMDILTLMTG